MGKEDSPEKQKGKQEDDETIINKMADYLYRIHMRLSVKDEEYKEFNKYYDSRKNLLDRVAHKAMQIMREHTKREAADRMTFEKNKQFKKFTEGAMTPEESDKFANWIIDSESLQKEYEEYRRNKSLLQDIRSDLKKKRLL